MTPERWQEVDALLAAALERPPEDRQPFLDRECGDDGTLSREVEELLAAAGKLGCFLEKPALEGSALEPTTTGLAHAGEAPDRLPAGGSIGPYRIERELGRGGMGTVYLALRADDAFRKEVAVKLLQPGMGSALVRRFQSERQILATLEHPAIARLLDGGTAADGRPYLVMEYIDGLPIDRYCDRRPRRQAGEHPGHRRRRPPAARLRHRQAPRPGGLPVPGRGDGDRAAADDAEPREP